MDNILTDLWYGNILPWEQFVRNDKNAKKLAARLSQTYDRVRADLTESQKELLEEYHNCEMELESENEKAAFVYGFCLGARLAAAVMDTQTGE